MDLRRVNDDRKPVAFLDADRLGLRQDHAKRLVVRHERHDGDVAQRFELLHDGSLNGGEPFASLMSDGRTPSESGSPAAIRSVIRGPLKRPYGVSNVAPSLPILTSKMFMCGEPILLAT